MFDTTKPCVLTIAGSDSGGNAGIEADLRVFHDYAIHGCVALASLTAQNPFGVSSIHNPPPEFVVAQLDAVLGVYDIRALKTGMLPDAPIAAAVARRLKSCTMAKIVDPVMIATSGAKLIGDDALAIIEKELIPQATLVTPNLPEARHLTGLGETADARTLAHAFYDRFGVAVLVKGGHAEGDALMTDVLYDGKTETLLAAERIANPVSTHGTGCSLSAAIAAGMAQGMSLVAAAARAKKHVYCAIRYSYPVGPECGVLAFHPQAPAHAAT